MSLVLCLGEMDETIGSRQRTVPCLVPDDRAREIIQKCSRCKTITECQSLEEEKKAQAVRKIYEKGVSIRQISRLTGSTKGLVEKWIKR